MTERDAIQIIQIKIYFCFLRLTAYGTCALAVPTPSPRIASHYVHFVNNSSTTNGSTGRLLALLLDTKLTFLAGP
jgi:hypothetical protein